MARKVIDPPLRERTTLVTYKVLLDKVALHTKHTGESLGDFFTKSLVNQLEKEGDIEIRSLINEVTENERD